MMPGAPNIEAQVRSHALSRTFHELFAATILFNFRVHGADVGAAQLFFYTDLRAESTGYFLSEIEPQRAVGDCMTSHTMSSV